MPPIRLAPLAVLPVCLIAITCLLPCVTAQMTPTLSARVVRTKQGAVKGVLVIPSNRDLQPVEAFLGLPYAAPPVGALRFMPPVSPLPWNGVRLMDKFAPACPQTLPDVNNEREALRHVSRGRLQYLRRLLPYLRNQSEDCLYLNIYAPVVVGGKDSNIKFPVIVFIHGESYEWNSGNPYDGSILASYGDVVVVTLNFRLGTLGFLRPDLKENRIANFGLLDQIAALQWIQENIGEFGGDRDSVTLMGHGTGAACVNLLLISPVAQASTGLFHRAILMSGTALADWATVDNPLRYTLQAAQQVDCPLSERDDELAACLRSKRVTELMNVRLQAPLFASPLAPVVDGVVVPNEPRLSMKTYNDLFGRYDVMYGVTQSESFHLLNAARLQLGLTEAERNGFVRTYVRNSYATNIDQVTAAILNAYTDWKDPIRDTNEYRDSLLDILSDARVVAPVVQMGDLHSAIRQRSYFYVFAHQTAAGDYPQHWGSVHGEELPYVFGMPLVGGTNHLSMNYTRAEMLLSEIVITYWANFARTGNPNFPPRQKFLTSNPRDRFEPSYVQWPAYDRHSQKYLNIELRPKVKDHYRADKMALWSKLIPELVSSVNGVKAITTGEDDDEDDESDGETSHEMSSESPAEADQAPVGRPGYPLFTGPSGTAGNTSDVALPVGEQGSIALSIVVVIGICLLVVNVCACAGVFYQKDRARFKEMLAQRQYKLRPAGSGKSESRSASKVGKSKRPARASSKALADEEFELDEMPSTLLHQASTSTIDPHTKVSQWIAQEVNADDQSSSPPRSHHLRPNRPDVTKFGGSDRYDPSVFQLPQLNKTAAASDICGLVCDTKGPSAADGNEDEHGHQQTRPALKSARSSDKAPSRTSTTRRKARARSQTNSILKRDVAVGGDDDDFQAEAPYSVTFDSALDRNSVVELSAHENAAMDTIRRLNLPKVLPDLPHHDATIPFVASTAPDSAHSSDAPPAARRAEEAEASDHRALGGPAPGNGPTDPSTPHHGAVIVKSNFPQTLVLAPHPRTGLPTAKAPTSPVSAEPEPCLIVRPGQRVAAAAHQPAPAPESDDPVRRLKKDSSGSSRPSSRNSRSWYAQYSQSFISQSIDQDDADDAQQDAG